MADSQPSISPMTATGALVGAMAVAVTGVNVTYTPSVPYTAPMGTTSPMNPQDHVLFDAKIDAKVADLRGDIRLNTNGLANLKERFDDLAAKMASVPTDIATIKAKIEHMPGKGFVVTAAILTVTGLSGVLVLLQKLGILQ